MTLADKEREKYEKIWTFPDYRRNAPGEGLVSKAIERLGMEPGDTVHDFGCGTGRASFRLKHAGLDVTSIDHAYNCLDEDMRPHLRFVQANLWDLPDALPVADWGFCTDVMEHIPEEYVEETLASIWLTADRGCFFQIATRKDSMGRLIGEPLHMTVRPVEWWADRLNVQWGDVRIEAQGRDFIAVCK